MEHTANKGELEECVLSYREDLDILNGTFRLQEAAKKSAVVHMEKSVGVGAPGEVENSSRIFADEASPREESLTLQYALYLVVLLLACELFCMFVRHHFINLMAYLSVLAIYFLNYFDAAYMKTVLAAVGIATVSDLAWLMLHSQVSFSNLALLVVNRIDPIFSPQRRHPRSGSDLCSCHCYWQGIC